MDRQPCTVRQYLWLGSEVTSGFVFVRGCRGLRQTRRPLRVEKVPRMWKEKIKKAAGCITGERGHSVSAEFWLISLINSPNNISFPVCDAN